MRYQDGLAVYMPPKRETRNFMKEELLRERRLRRRAEEMQDFYRQLATAGGIVMVFLTCLLLYVA